VPDDFSFSCVALSLSIPIIYPYDDNDDDDDDGVIIIKRYMTVTMMFGSFIAGSTSEGGAAVAFPVLTLVFHVKVR